MNRRSFLALSTLAIAASPVWADSNMKVVDYTPETYEKALASGEPLLLDFSASW